MTRQDSRCITGLVARVSVPHMHLEWNMGSQKVRPSQMSRRHENGVYGYRACVTRVLWYDIEIRYKREHALCDGNILETLKFLGTAASDSRHELFTGTDRESLLLICFPFDIGKPDNARLKRCRRRVVHEHSRKRQLLANKIAWEKPLYSSRIS